MISEFFYPYPHRFITSILIKKFLKFQKLPETPNSVEIGLFEAE